MREAVKQLEARLGERRSRTEIVLDLEARLRLDADRTLLSQALANLLDNAVEAHAEGPIHVRIAARAEPGSFVRIAARRRLPRAAWERGVRARSVRGSRLKAKRRLGDP